MKSLFSTSWLAAAAIGFVLSQTGPSQAAKDGTIHQVKKQSAKLHYAQQRARASAQRNGLARPGHLPGIGPVLYGYGGDGPPNGGAYTTYPTNDPSIGYFPGLWDAERRGGCVIDDGYGRYSDCDAD